MGPILIAVPATLKRPWQPFAVLCLVAVIGVAAAEERAPADRTVADKTAAHSSPSPKATALEALLTAEMALARRDYDRAFELYLKEARRTRKSEILATATQLAVRLGRGETRELARLWAAAAPAASEPHAVLARVYMDAGDWRRSLSEVVALRRLEVDAPIDEWLSHLREESVKVQTAALLAVRDDARKLPRDAQLLRAQATLLSLLGRLNEALELMQGFAAPDADLQRAMVQVLVALGRFDEARRVVQSRIAAGDDAGEWRMQLVRHLLKAHAWAPAREELETLIASRRDSNEVLLDLAYVALQQNDPVRVREAVAPLLEDPDGRALAWFYLGQAAEQEHKWEQAAAAYKQVPAGEHYLNAQTRVAATLMQQNRVDDARLLLEKLRAREPDAAADLYLAQAELQSQHSEPTAALATLNEALGQFSDNTELLYARGMAFYAAQQFDAMEADLKRAIAIDQFHAKALNGLGYMLADRGLRLSEAESLIARALEVAPDDAAVLDSMGWVLYRLGRRQDALDYLQRAWTLQPAADVAAHYGEVLWQVGRTKEAQRIWLDGLKLDAANALILKARSRAQETKHQQDAPAA